MRNRIVALGLVAAAAALFCARDVSAGDDAARIADLVSDLSDQDAHVRDVARKQLVALGGAAVPQLVALLKSEQGRGRVEAVQVLAALGPAARSAAPALADRVKAESGAARMPFLRALAAVDPEGSCTFTVPILLSFLDDRDPALRLDAANALRDYGPAATSFVPAMIEKTAVADAPVRAALLDAVRAMGVDAASSVVDLYAKADESHRASLSAVVAELGEAVVPAAGWCSASSALRRRARRRNSSRRSRTTRASCVAARRTRSARSARIRRSRCRLSRRSSTTRRRARRSRPPRRSRASPSRTAPETSSRPRRPRS
jgi:HEAT repeat protein